MSNWDGEYFEIDGVAVPAVDVIRQMDTGCFDVVNMCLPGMVMHGQHFYELYCEEHLRNFGTPFVYKPKGVWRILWDALRGRLFSWWHWKTVLRLAIFGNGLCAHCNQWRHEHVDDQCLFASTRYKKVRNDARHVNGRSTRDQRIPRP